MEFVITHISARTSSAHVNVHSHCWLFLASLYLSLCMDLLIASVVNTHLHILSTVNGLENECLADAVFFHLGFLLHVQHVFGIIRAYGGAYGIAGC